MSAVAGLGDALVSGDVDADSAAVDRNGAVLDRVASSILDDELAREVASSHAGPTGFGRPQDIEWAIEKGRLFLLQSRPITALQGRSDPDGALNLWDNSNIAESYNGVTTPLTFSFARRAYEEVYRQFCRMLARARRRRSPQRRRLPRRCSASSAGGSTTTC